MLRKLAYNTKLIFSSFWRIAIMLLVFVGVAYVGITIAANVGGNAGEHKPPDIKKARYEIVIRNTGKVLYTDSYSKDGTVYTLDGYWEIVKDRYRYKDFTTALDTDTFGVVTVKNR